MQEKIDTSAEKANWLALYWHEAKEQEAAAKAHRQAIEAQLQQCIEAAIAAGEWWVNDKAGALNTGTVKYSRGLETEAKFYGNHDQAQHLLQEAAKIYQAKNSKEAPLLKFEYKVGAAAAKALDKMPEGRELLADHGLEVKYIPSLKLTIAMKGGPEDE